MVDYSAVIGYILRMACKWSKCIIILQGEVVEAEHSFLVVESELT